MKLTQSTTTGSVHFDAPSITKATAKPFVKWPGGKFFQLDKLMKRMPEYIGGTYVEPFVGGGSVDEYLTSKQVCEELGISSRQFQKYRDERRIAFSQFGRKIYVRRSDLNAFIANHRIASRYEQ